MNCEFCETPNADEVVEGMLVCKECKKKAKDNFFLICETCGCRGTIPRTMHNIARLSTLYLVDNDIEINESTLNTMIANVQVTRPVFTYLTSCPMCEKQGGSA